MRRKTRSTEVTVDVDLELFELTREEFEDLTGHAESIVRLCSLVEQPFDRKAIADKAQRIVDTLEDWRRV